jgi:hypothetical protein
MKWGRRFNERLILTAPILGTRKTTEFAACHNVVPAICDLFGTERIVA